MTVTENPQVNIRTGDVTNVQPGAYASQAITALTDLGCPPPLAALLISGAVTALHAGEPIAGMTLTDDDLADLPVKVRAAAYDVASRLHRIAYPCEQYRDLSQTTPHAAWTVREALHYAATAPADPEEAPVTTQTTATLPVGTIVDYHGSITAEHGEYIVVAVDSTGRYLIASREYPWFELCQVHPESLTPTGEVADLCDCGHEYAATAGPAWPSRCGVTNCDCTTHTKEEAK